MCKLWNCRSIDGVMDGFMFSSVKIISTLFLLLTCFYNLSICVFMIWLASQTSWLELFSEPSRAGLLARLYNEPSRASVLTSRAITSRAGSLSSPIQAVAFSWCGLGSGCLVWRALTRLPLGQFVAIGEFAVVSVNDQVSFKNCKSCTELSVLC